MDNNIIQFEPSTEQITLPEEKPKQPEPAEENGPRFWDHDEIQAVIREAFRRGIDPSRLFAEAGFDPAA